MKNYKFTLYCVGIFFFIANTVLGQQNISAREGETLELNGTVLSSNQTIQWQESTDNSTWTDIVGGTILNYEVTLVNLPKYYRAKISDSSCTEDMISEVISVSLDAATRLLWSDPNTWGAAGKPVAGDQVVIPEGKHVYLDEDTPNLAEVTIEGVLEFERKDLSFTAKNIAIMGGRFVVGAENNLFGNKATITLSDTDTSNEVMGMGTRGILVLPGGSLELYGKSPNVIWTKINQHARDGATSLTLATQTDWSVGDEIVLGPTDFYEADNGRSITQKIPIASNSGTNLNLSNPIESFHWGELQYASLNGLSSSPGNLVPTRQIPAEFSDFSYGIEFENPTVLDERAPIGNLTRNIVIQAPDDNTWRNEGFGVHIMVMPSAKAYLDGVEIKRGGQQGRERRYPFHWHMLSYSGSQDLGDATGQFVKNSTINESKNRGIVVHGTNGTLVQNNIVYNVKGHGIFTEDAAERRNVFDGNLVLRVRNPEFQHAIKLHELAGFETGSSGFWISNPDNVTTNNHVGDSEGNGYWFAFPARPFGLSSQALNEGQAMIPHRMLFDTFENNTAHTCKGNALHNDTPEINEAGATGSLGNYISDVNSFDNDEDRSSWRRFDVRKFSAWKSLRAIWERANYVNTIEAVAADNQETFFAGAGSTGLIIGCLAVGRSENHAQNSSAANNRPTPAGFATYHHTFNMMANVGVNFPATGGTNSGMFSTRDYYLRPVEKGHWLSFDNLLINSHPGVKLSAIQSYGISATAPHFNLAGAMWDPHGFWGPKDQYVVFDRPFYTHNSPVTEIHGRDSSVSGGVSVPGPFFGFDEIAFTPGFTTNVLGKKFTRFDDDLNVIDSFTLTQNNNDLLQWMKDAAFQANGIYSIEFPQDNSPTRVIIQEITNMLNTQDEVVVGVEYNGNVNCSVTLHPRFGFGNQITAYTEVSSLNEVRNSNNEVFWQDHTGNMVWMKIKGGRINEPLTIDFWEDNTYQAFQIELNPR